MLKEAYVYYWLIGSVTWYTGRDVGDVCDLAAFSPKRCDKSGVRINSSGILHPGVQPSIFHLNPIKGELQDWLSLMNRPPYTFSLYRYRKFLNA
jgi:hypothetical protein